MILQIEQSFGPIVGLQSVSGVDEATKVLNSSKYGLESFIFTQNEAQMNEFTNSLNVGTVNFNHAPLVYDDYLPVSGRKRSAKMLKGGRHIFTKYSNYKSVIKHIL